jgi:ribosomal protein S21
MVFIKKDGIMIEVRPKDNSDEAFTKALSTFKKICNKDGFLKEIRDRRYYQKPSEKKREYLRKIKREHAKQLVKESKLY